MTGIVSIILLVVFAIASVLVVLVVLVQDEQGEGLGGLFAGSSASFGPRRGNILTRFTSIIGAVFLVGAFALAWVNRTPEMGDVAAKARLEQLQSGEGQDWFVESDSSTVEATDAQAGGTEAGATQAGAESKAP